MNPAFDRICSPFPALARVVLLPKNSIQEHSRCILTTRPNTGEISTREAAQADTITIVETTVVETRKVVERETGVHNERDRHRDWKGESPGLETFQSELLKTMPTEQLQVLQTWPKEILAKGEPLTKVLKQEMTGRLSLLHKGGQLVVLNITNQLITYMSTRDSRPIMFPADIDLLKSLANMPLSVSPMSP